MVLLLGIWIILLIIFVFKIFGIKLVFIFWILCGFGFFLDKIGLLEGLIAIVWNLGFFVLIVFVIFVIVLLVLILVIRIFIFLFVFFYIFRVVVLLWIFGLVGFWNCCNI